VFWKPSGTFDPNTPPPRQAVFDQRVLAGSLTHSLAEAVRRTARYHLASEPGSRFGYSGAAFNVAGRVAEVAAGTPFEELLRREVLAPVGMTRTTFRPTSSEYARMPVKYTKGSTGLRPLPPAIPTTGEPRFVMASGGLASTLDDCARFLRVHLDGGRIGAAALLSEDALREMTTDHTIGRDGNTEGRGYGLGWSIDRLTPQGRPLTISHGGALGTTLWIDLDRELAGVFLTQMQPPTPAVRETTRRIQELVRDAVPATVD
jgi:CubicO group peptidase (beta-lactamase class C family)